MGLMSMASAARMAVISEQIDATDDRFIGICSPVSLFFNFHPIPLKHCTDGGIAQQLFALAVVEVVVDRLQCGLRLL